MGALAASVHLLKEQMGEMKEVHGDRQGAPSDRQGAGCASSFRGPSPVPKTPKEPKNPPFPSPRLPCCPEHQSQEEHLLTLERYRIPEVESQMHQIQRESCPKELVDVLGAIHGLHSTTLEEARWRRKTATERFIITAGAWTRGSLSKVPKPPQLSQILSPNPCQTPLSYACLYPIPKHRSLLLCLPLTSLCRLLLLHLVPPADGRGASIHVSVAAAREALGHTTHVNTPRSPLPLETLNQSRWWMSDGPSLHKQYS